MPSKLPEKNLDWRGIREFPDGYIYVRIWLCFVLFSNPIIQSNIYTIHGPVNILFCWMSSLIEDSTHSFYRLRAKNQFQWSKHTICLMKWDNKSDFLFHLRESAMFASKARGNKFFFLNFKQSSLKGLFLDYFSLLWCVMSELLKAHNINP